MLGQLVVEVAGPHASTYGRHLLRDRNRAHRCDVEDNPVGRGSAGNRVPAAPDRCWQAEAPRDGKGRGDVRGGRASYDGRWPHVLEARHHGLAYGFVVGRARQDDVAFDPPLQRTPVGGHSRALPKKTVQMIN